MKKSDTFELLKPIIVLTVICIVSSALLGLVNYAADPIISERKAAETLATQKSFFPEASSFTEIGTSENGVQSVFRADCGGYIITVETGGYNGTFPVLVGISEDGSVIGVSPDVSGETVNKGTLAGEKEYTDKFLGLTGNADDVDVIAGATISSKAVRSAVSRALAVYDIVKEG